MGDLLFVILAALRPAAQGRGAKLRKVDAGRAAALPAQDKGAGQVAAHYGDAALCSARSKKLRVRWDQEVLSRSKMPTTASSGTVTDCPR